MQQKIKKKVSKNKNTINKFKKNKKIKSLDIQWKMNEKYYYKI